MTQEDKKLLIKDLCERLPYEVKIRIDRFPTENHHFFLHTVDTLLDLVNSVYFIEDVKPYLFPMSSMTEEQRKELLHEEGIIVDDNGYISPHLPYGDLDYMKYFDWLNKNHFDYRGLIDKGLAIDCTNLNIY